MTRVTISDVKQLITTSLTDAEVITHIQIATELVDNVLGSETSLSNAMKKWIEGYLAAHFIAIGKEQKSGITEMEVGDTRVKYGASFGEYLKATSYGQAAAQLDTTGKLASTGNIKALFRNM